MKAFIFTLDALFALSLMVLATTAVFVYAQQSTSDSRLAQLNQLGRDYLELNEIGVGTSADRFAELTGLNVTQAQPSGEAVRAALYSYPALCGGRASVPAGDPCLSQDLTAGYFVPKQAWVLIP